MNKTYRCHQCRCEIDAILILQHSKRIHNESWLAELEGKDTRYLEFDKFQCPHCGYMASEIKDIGDNAFILK